MKDFFIRNEASTTVFGVIVFSMARVIDFIIVAKQPQNN